MDFQTRTCLLRIVVRPNELLSRAYSSLPTRIRVFSSSCTTAAITLRRGSPGAEEILAIRRRSTGNPIAKASISS